MKKSKNSNIVRSLSELNPDDMGVVSRAAESADVPDNPNDAPEEQTAEVSDPTTDEPSKEGEVVKKPKREKKPTKDGLTIIDETDINSIKRKIGALHRSIQILLNKGELNMADHNKLYARQIECDKYEALLKTL